VEGEKSRQDLLGEILIEKGLLTPEQFEECRASFLTTRKVGVKTTLLKVVCDKGYLTEPQAADIRRELVRRGFHPKLGDYELLEKIGAGGMGAVFKARHPRLDTLVAIKVLLPQVAQDETFVRRFEREARLAARVGSGLVHVMDVQHAGGRHFIVMEYVEGESVARRLAREGALPERDALRILRDAARALQGAHDKGVVHRDVKPSNILLASSGEVKLTDLGLAKDLTAVDSALTHSGAGMGSPNYIAPEQVKDAKSADHRADIYSLGATFYHMVTGRPPFDGETAYEVMLKHVSEPPPRPDAVNPGLSAATADLALRMLTKDPDRRIGTCREVADEADALLRRLEAGLPMPVPRKRRRPGGWPVVAAAAGVAAAVVALLAGFLAPRPAAPRAPESTPPPRVAEVPESLEPLPEETPTPVPEPPPKPPPEPAPSPAPKPPGREPLFSAPPLPPLRARHIFRPPPAVFLDMAVAGDMLWCATDVGPAVYDTRAETWRFVDLPRDRLEIQSVRVHDVLVDAKGRKWFAGFGFVAALDGEAWSRHRLPEREVRAMPSVRLGLVGGERLCAVASDALYVLEGGRFRTVPYEDLGTPLDVDTAPDGTLFGLLRKGLVLYDGRAAPRLVRFPPAWGAGPSKGWVLGVSRDRCWLSLVQKPGSRAGLWTYRDGKVVRPMRGRKALEYLVGPLVRHPRRGPVFVGPRLLSFDAKLSEPPMRVPWDAAVCDARGVCYVIRRTTGSLGGLRRLDGKEGAPIPVRADLPGPARGLALDAQGRAWVATDRALARYDGDNWRILPLEGEAAFSGRRLRDVAADGRGVVYVLAEGRVPRPRGRPALRRRPILRSRLSWLLLAREAGRWRRTGVEVFDLSPRLLGDPRGGVWMYGRAGGVRRYDGERSRLWSQGNGLLSNAGDLALGGDEPRVVFLPRGRQALQRYEGGRWRTMRFSLQVPGSGGAVHLQRVAVDRDGVAWGWSPAPAALVRIEGERATAYPVAAPGARRPATAMAFDPDGRLWLGLIGAGLVCFDGRSSTFFRGGRGLAGDTVQQVAFRRGEVWVLCGGAVSRLVFGGGGATGR